MTEWATLYYIINLCIYITWTLKFPVFIGPISANQPFSHSEHLANYSLFIDGKGRVVAIAVQSPFDINFLWPLGYIRKLAFGSLFHSWFVCSQHTALTIIKLAQTLPPQGTNPHRREECHFLWPENFTLNQGKIRTRNLSICSRTRYH